MIHLCYGDNGPTKTATVHITWRTRDSTSKGSEPQLSDKKKTEWILVALTKYP